MAETILKRLRSEETSVVDEEQDQTKRQKYSNYNQILSLLDEEEEEPNQDIVSSFITTLQLELFSEPTSPSPSSSSGPVLPQTDVQSLYSNNTAASSYFIFKSSSPFMSKDHTSEDDDDECDMERIMRHLLEASDDELGIPHKEEDEGNINGGSGSEFSLEMWELEDEAANFYTLLQSELFL